MRKGKVKYKFQEEDSKMCFTIKKKKKITWKGGGFEEKRRNEFQKIKYE